MLQTSGANERQDVAKFTFQQTTQITDPGKHSPADSATGPNTPRLTRGNAKKRSGSCRMCIHPHWKKACANPRNRPDTMQDMDVQTTHEEHHASVANNATTSHDQTPVKGTTIADVDENALKRYRVLREKVNPAAEELTYNDSELLGSLGCVNKENPNELNIAGLLLFGSSKIQFYPGHICSTKLSSLC
jgi:hypothetical protein